MRSGYIKNRIAWRNVPCGIMLGQKFGMKRQVSVRKEVVLRILHQNPIQNVVESIQQAYNTAVRNHDAHERERSRKYREPAAQYRREYALQL